MFDRESFLENFAGDLEYHPRRAAVYLVLAALTFAIGYFFPADPKVMIVPPIFVLGSLALAGKAIYLLRKSSEGIGLTYLDEIAVTAAARRKTLGTFPAQASQIVQDFGCGPFLLWPLLNYAPFINPMWLHAPRGIIILSGAAIFGFGYLLRKALTPATP